MPRTTPTPYLHHLRHRPTHVQHWSTECSQQCQFNWTERNGSTDGCLSAQPGSESGFLFVCVCFWGSWFFSRVDARKPCFGPWMHASLEPCFGPCVVIIPIVVLTPVFYHSAKFYIRYSNVSLVGGCLRWIYVCVEIAFCEHECNWVNGGSGGYRGSCSGTGCRGRDG